MAKKPLEDGIHAMVPRDKMTTGARKMRDYYDIVPGAPLYKKEFGYYSLERWKEQGMPQDVPFEKLFDFDGPGTYGLWGCGWCEAAFEPKFEEKIVEDRGAHEVVQDFAGRKVLCFKGRRSGFMPDYLDHPVKDQKTWEDDVKWRLDPKTPVRFKEIDKVKQEAVKAAGEGQVISQRVVGGYMYLRSLIGPEQLFYAFYDIPDVIHDCMKTWLAIAETVSVKHQEFVTLDEFFIGEDICYNHGPLISPDMIKEFIFPYYQQLMTNMKRRQIDKKRHFYFNVDTDGFCDPVIPLYMSIGMDVMSPFEAASNCDVVRAGKEYPKLVISGGLDKRELAKGRKAIDAMLERIIPPMRARGGYIPTCDHGVPEEVPYKDYLYYRKRVVELGG